jgi:hypothetical protein
MKRNRYHDANGNYSRVDQNRNLILGPSERDMGHGSGRGRDPQESGMRLDSGFGYQLIVRCVNSIIKEL